jgi:PPE-repeat protein
MKRLPNGLVLLGGLALGLVMGLNCGGSASRVSGDNGGVAGSTGGGANAGQGSGNAGQDGTAGAGGSGTGTAGAGGSGTGTAGAGGSGTGTAGTGAGGSGTAGAGGGISAAAGCPVNPSQCTDGIDNDGDGLIDADDPECTGPCDNSEGSFATGIPGDNSDACKQDCFFDGDSGAGNDGCNWNLKCDPLNPGAHAEKTCPYDEKFKGCDMQQSDMCIKFCQRLTPNGCDCFGCCTLPGRDFAVKLQASCTQANYDDPVKCPRCTQTTSCVNTCGKCEICLGKPMPDPGCDLPPPGTMIGGGGMGGSGAGGMGGSEGPCPSGVVYCGTDSSSCPSGYFCLTGCCIRNIP